MAEPTLKCKRLSLATVKSIFRALERNLLLVLALRPTIKDENSRQVSKWLAANGKTLCLHLSELSKKNSIRLASKVFQVMKLPRELATALFERTRGHPRFIIEISELLLSEQRVIVEDGTCRISNNDYKSLKLPESVRAGK